MYTFVRRFVPLFVFVASLGLLLAACGADPTSTPSPSPTPSPTPPPIMDVTPSPGEPFQLHVNDRAILDANGFTIDFVGVVSDSRCAVDVVCMTAGRAVVELSIRTSATEPASSFKFGIGDTGPEPATQVVGRYRITLTALDPQPYSDGRPLDYVVTLVFEEA